MAGDARAVRIAHRPGGARRARSIPKRCGYPRLYERRAPSWWTPPPATTATRATATMSLECTVWVLRNSPSTLADRLTLWAIADECDKAGLNLFGIGYERIAAHANVSERTAVRCVANLEAAGELLVARRRGRGRSNLYAVAMGRNPLELADQLGWERPTIDPARAAAETVTDCHRYLEAERVTTAPERVTTDAPKGDTVSPDPQRPDDDPRAPHQSEEVVGLRDLEVLDHRLAIAAARRRLSPLDHLEVTP